LRAGTSIQFRTVALFCAVAAVLLVGCFAGVHALFEREIRNQLDRQLSETAAPVIADQVADPEERDVDQLNLPDAYFEVLDGEGKVLQRSKNLKLDLPLSAATDRRLPASTSFETVSAAEVGELRAAVVPFEVEGKTWALVVAGTTRQVRGALSTFTTFAAVLFGFSLALMALVSTFYARKLELVVGQLRQFVSDASHELKTPLSVLRGETELLLSRPRSTGEYEQALQIMESELKTMSSIVEGLFTLSMADAGQLKFAPEPVFVDDVLEESIALATPLAESRGIRIEKNLQHGVMLPGNAAFLRQLFLIFLDNAIKYSPTERPLRVSLATGADVRVCFEDQGFGIAKEHLHRVFERFFRVGKGSDVESQSGGLGLAIAQAIVRAHGGSIECQSELGVGSVFTVRLPSSTR